MIRKISLFFIALILIPGVINAQEQYKAGTHYVELTDSVGVRADKIEVVEVFWYGCGHCYRFEPLMHKWEETLPTDVTLVRSPAVWNNNMKLHARAFYTAEVLGKLDVMHMPIFEAMNKDNNRLATEGEIAKLFVSNGIDKDEFTKAFNSFGVMSSVRQADARARGYKIGGTPEMIVNGKYRVGARQAGGQENMLKVVDYLIKKEREAKTKS